jgi:hypothetical protein
VYFPFADFTCRVFGAAHESAWAGAQSSNPSNPDAQTILIQRRVAIVIWRSFA